MKFIFAFLWHFLIDALRSRNKALSNTTHIDWHSPNSATFALLGLCNSIIAQSQLYDLGPSRHAGVRITLSVILESWSTFSLRIHLYSTFIMPRLPLNNITPVLSLDIFNSLLILVIFYLSARASTKSEIWLMFRTCPQVEETRHVSVWRLLVKDSMKHAHPLIITVLLCASSPMLPNSLTLQRLIKIRVLSLHAFLYQFFFFNILVINSYTIASKLYKLIWW